MGHIVHLANFFGIAAILALSLNLVVGYTGLVSLAHAAFYAIGGYATAIVTVHYGANFFVGLGAGVVIAMLVAAIVGSVFSRFRGDYYTLATLAFTVIITNILTSWESLTNGPIGITGIRRPIFFGTHLITASDFLIFVVAMVVIVYCIVHYVTASSFGRTLKAIREDEDALQVFGYRTSHYKLAVFVISAGLAAIAGALFAAYLLSIDPLSFTMVESIMVLSMIILGGLANHKGALLGAFCITFLPELLRYVGLETIYDAQIRQIIYGVLLILLMIYRPRGFIGEYKL